MLALFSCKLQSMDSLRLLRCPFARGCHVEQFSKFIRIIKCKAMSSLVTIFNNNSVVSLRDKGRSRERTHYGIRLGMGTHFLHGLHERIGQKGSQIPLNYTIFRFSPQKDNDLVFLEPIGIRWLQRVFRVGR